MRCLHLFVLSEALTKTVNFTSAGHHLKELNIISMRRVQALELIDANLLSLRQYEDTSTPSRSVPDVF